MENVSFIKKLKILNDIILSSPLFLFLIMIFEIGLIVYILFKRKKFQINKWMVLGIWGFIILFIIVVYNKVVFNLLDNFINYIFTALYFPNLAVYAVVLTLSNIFLFISIFSKNIEKYHKILNITNAVIINSLLLFIIDVVNNNNIDIYEKLTVFSNNSLLVLLELSTGVFTSWIILNLFLSLKIKLKKYDKKEYPDMPDIIFN